MFESRPKIVPEQTREVGCISKHQKNSVFDKCLWNTVSLNKTRPLIQESRPNTTVSLNKTRPVTWESRPNTTVSLNKTRPVTWESRPNTALNKARPVIRVKRKFSMQFIRFMFDKFSLCICYGCSVCNCIL